MRVDPGPFALGPVGGGGPAVLCLHGLTGTPYEVRPPAEALSASGFACVGPLLPGHGETPEALEAALPSAWIETALRQFDALKATHERVYVLGLSLGGLLALTLSVRRPVAGLLVLAAPLRLRLLPRLVAPLLSRVIRFLPKRPAIADTESRLRHPGTDPMPLRAVLSLQEVQTQVEQELERVSAPIHLIFSRKDPVVHPRNAERILARVSSARRSVRYLERSLHVITVDLEREEVAQECVRFLHQLEGGSPAASLVDVRAAPP